MHSRACRTFSLCSLSVDRARVEFNHNLAASNEIPDHPVKRSSTSLDSLLGAIMKALMRESTPFVILKLVMLERLSQ